VAGIGCASLIIVTFVVVIAGFFIARSAFRSVVAEYADTDPMVLPTVEASDDERAAVQAQFDAFQEALMQGTEVSALTLTEDEANILIRFHPDLEALRDNIYVKFEEGVVRGDVSIPLDHFEHIPVIGGLVSGHYLNGSGTFSLQVANGRLEVHPVGIEVRGETLPDEFMNELRSINLFDRLDQDHDVARKIQRLDRIEIHDGSITFVPKTAGLTI